MARIYNSVNDPQSSASLQRNIYTTEQVEYRLRQKADKTSVYSKVEVDNKIQTLSDLVLSSTNEFNGFLNQFTYDNSDVPLKWDLEEGLFKSCLLVEDDGISPIPLGWDSNLKQFSGVYPVLDTGENRDPDNSGIYLGRQTIIRGGFFNSNSLEEQQNSDLALENEYKYIYNFSGPLWKQFENNNRLILKHSVSPTNSSLGDNSLFTGELAININTGDIFVGWEGKSVDFVNDIPLAGIKRLFSPLSYVQTSPAYSQSIKPDDSANVPALIIEGGNVALGSEEVRSDILQINTRDGNKKIYVNSSGQLKADVIVTDTLNSLSNLTVPVSVEEQGQFAGIRYNPDLDIFEGYIDGWSPLTRGEYVTLRTPQNISAEKWFDEPIHVQPPTEDDNPATKKYVDDELNKLDRLNIPGTGYLKKNAQGVWYLDRKIGFLNRIFYVSKDGNDANDGTSIETSKLTIKAALQLTNNTALLNKAFDAAKILDANREFLKDEVFGYVIRTYPELQYSPNINPSGVGEAGRFRDGSDLIKANKAEIIDTAYSQMMAEFPGFVNPNEQKCRRDLGYIVDALVGDLYTGGNSYIIQATRSYFTNGSLSSNGLLGEITQSVFAFNKVRDLTKLAVTNQLTIKNTNLIPDPATGSNTSVNSCADVRSAIDNLISILTTCLEGGSLTTLPTDIAYGPWSYLYDNSLCKRDLGYIIDAITADLRSGGNINSIDTAEAYYSNTNLLYITNEKEEAIDAINKLRDLCILAVRNWSINSNGDKYQPQYSLQSPVILNDIVQENYPQCNDIASIISIYTEVMTTILQNGIGSVQDIPPFTGSTIFVKNGTYRENNPLFVPPEVSIIGDNLRDVTVIPINKDRDIFWVNNGSYISEMSFRGHRYPSAAIAFPEQGAGAIIKSPYIQNCTSFGTTGAGMRVDGNRAQGLRSMVLDSYTQYNQGGTGIEVINSGYAQLVSIFTICCDKAVYAASGGTCSITNSNTDFGNYGLVADGVSPLQYSAKINGDQNSANVLTLKNVIKKPYLGQVVTINKLYYFVQKLKIINPGSGYNVPPKITIDNPTGINGIQAKATCTVKNGKLVEIILVSSGRQYEFVPQVTVEPSPGGITAEIEAEIYPVYYTVLSATDPVDGECTLTLEENLPYLPLNGEEVNFYQVSKIIASSHCFEYVGAGTNISKARPEMGGITKTENEVIRINGGRVAVTSTDQSGNFKIGADLTLNQNIGTLTGRTFTKSLFVSITPLILALEG